MVSHRLSCISGTLGHFRNFQFFSDFSDFWKSPTPIGLHPSRPPPHCPGTQGRKAWGRSVPENGSKPHINMFFHRFPCISDTFGHFWNFRFFSDFSWFWSFFVGQEESRLWFSRKFAKLGRRKFEKNLKQKVKNLRRWTDPKFCVESDFEIKNGGNRAKKIVFSKR